MKVWLAIMWLDIGERFTGPMMFRLILQPTMASLLALRAGLKDAREGRPPYFWTLLTEPTQRAELLREGWKAIAKVFIVAVIMDVIYQWIVQRWVQPLEVLFVAIVLAIVPYLLIRGPVNRLARRRLSKGEDLALKGD